MNKQTKQFLLEQRTSVASDTDRAFIDWLLHDDNSDPQKFLEEECKLIRTVKAYEAKDQLREGMKELNLPYTAVDYIINES
jgi:hypothetical protein